MPAHRRSGVTCVGCRWSFRVGIVHETINVIDLVISEATVDERVISTPVWINPNTSFHSICVRHVLCRKDVFQGLSRASCTSLIPTIRKKSLVQSIFLVSLFLKEHGFARSLAWPTRQELHQADEPTVVQSASSHHPWILQPKLRPQKCSRPDSQRANR